MISHAKLLASYRNKNIQVFTAEMHEVKNDSSRKIFSDFFAICNLCNLRKQHSIRLPFVKTVYHGIETISHILVLKHGIFFRH